MSLGLERMASVVGKDYAFRKETGLYFRPLKIEMTI